MIAFEDARIQIEEAADYYTFFGPAPGDPAAHVKKVYLSYARVVHPDLHQASPRLTTAETAFKRLGEHYAQALEMAAQDAYGQPLVIVEWTHRRASHRVLRAVSGGDLCATYLARTKLATDVDEQPSFCKVVKAHADRDLLQTEARVVRQLRGPGMAAEVHVFYPELLDSFVHREKGKQPRQVNVLVQLENFYNLAQVRRSFPKGLEAVHMAWIWRRMLWALAHAHELGIVHGAILPEHIMILPEQHGVVIVDWCYASLKDDAGVFAPVKAIVGAYKDWYPEEVFAKAAPSSATDLTMAARCMIQLLGGDPITGDFPGNSAVPRQFRAFFRGCLSTSRSARPQNGFQLLVEFDQLLKHLGQPYYPRKFRTFTMPSGTVKS
ncbi:MAG: hypothetical protein ACQR33_01050 [Candidatus Saccharibacteria bacterium]